MSTPRISASSYSNTAPLVWSFLYGSNHGKVEMILDNAPARSAQLISEGRVDTALVPVIAYQHIEGLRLVPDVCVGARERVRSVCLAARCELADVTSVALDVSSQTSATLTKIVFREFVGTEPIWTPASPDLDAMLSSSDAALLIGDPALVLADHGETASGIKFQKFDLAELWRQHTGLGFIFAMWMTRLVHSAIDLAAARDEGCRHIDDIISNYIPQIALGREEMYAYLTENITYKPDRSMLEGMELYFRLAAAHGLIPQNRSLTYI